MIDVVDPAGTRYDQPGIVVDAAGTVHVSFLQELKLSYARRAAGSQSWVVEPISEAIYTNSAIAVDPQGGAHVLYLEGGTFRVTIADRAANGEWTSSRVAGLGRGDVLLSLLADASSGLHAVASTGASTELQTLDYYHRPSGGAWDRAFIDTTAQIMGPASLALDASDTPHVTYWDQEAKQVMYADPSSGSWEAEMVDASEYGASPSIGIDQDGSIELSYLSAFDGVMEARRAGGSTWTPKVVMEGSFESTAMARDAGGHVHVALGNSSGNFEFATSGRLTHLERAANGAWSTTEIVPDGVDGRPAIATDAAGGVHIVFHDDTTGALEHAYRAPCP